jgi:hypothetical protein
MHYHTQLGSIFNKVIVIPGFDCWYEVGVEMNFLFFFYFLEVVAFNSGLHAC